MVGYYLAMYMMYVDESGDPGMVNSPGDHFVLSGIVMHERVWRDFVLNLVDFRRTLKAAYGLPIRTEIHSAEYIRKNVHGIQKFKRLAILRNCLDELAKRNDILITNVVVEKVGKAPDFDVFEFAWKTLFQRFENTLKYGNFPGAFRQDLGMVFTDATAGNKLLRLVRRMSVFNPVPNQSWMGLGFRNLPIVKIIEDPHGKDSRDSLIIQMADVCAYFLHQKFKPNGYIKKQGASRYFDRLKPVLNLRASGSDPLGVVVV